MLNRKLRKRDLDFTLPECSVCGFARKCEYSGARRTVNRDNCVATKGEPGREKVEL